VKTPVLVVFPEPRLGVAQAAEPLNFAGAEGCGVPGFRGIGRKIVGFPGRGVLFLRRRKKPAPGPVKEGTPGRIARVLPRRGRKHLDGPVTVDIADFPDAVGIAVLVA
jgi:hypothetical protein